jgi:hypothetical protein
VTREFFAIVAVPEPMGSEITSRSVSPPGLSSPGVIAAGSPLHGAVRPADVQPVDAHARLAAVLAGFRTRQAELGTAD